MQVIRTNSAHYSAWEWRWQCFQELLADDFKLLAKELRFLRGIAGMNPKNYQLWNYRRRVAMLRGAAHAQEVLGICALVLSAMMLAIGLASCSLPGLPGCGK